MTSKGKPIDHQGAGGPEDSVDVAGLPALSLPERPRGSLRHRQEQQILAGKKKNENSETKEIFDTYQSAVKLNYFDEPIKKVGAGKFHSLFLTESGKLFAVGFNRYGQLGISNSIFIHCEDPTEVFTDGLKLTDMSIGQHHNLLMDEEGKLYGFGARLNGQMDGTNHTGREEQCSIMEIPVPIPQG
eukprot:CAMPEP_0170565002 /NCGR_PEP_ID=MMETSP0211-20121228/76157_1 /TAXON_ID=311385 /ORGANISM="Pseudokeronopsis sp., Strain OXSARD2" /LENGTH=185 /DNA_ID=CAMNT_0010885221 /DNA_START=70 /DNA_END=625 /DNA_ORIENTATION=+